MSSRTTMAADSTQAEPRDKYKKLSHRAGSFEYHKTKEVNKKSKKGVSSASHGREMQSGKRSCPAADDSCSDHDSDLDLNNELLPISGYVSNCESMVGHMFRSISMKKLKAMLPEILKKVEINDLKQLCTDQLEGMSKKRICRILDGDDPDEISSSEAEDRDSNSSQHKVDFEAKDDVNGSTRPYEVITTASTNSMKNLGHIATQECHDVSVTSKTSSESCEKAQSNLVENNLLKVSPSSKTTMTTTTCFDGIGELDYNEDSTSDEHSSNSIPSLASEPKDTCLPYKLMKDVRRDNNSTCFKEEELKGEESDDTIIRDSSSLQVSSSQHRCTVAISSSSSSSLQCDMLSCAAENENNLNAEVELGRITTLPARQALSNISTTTTNYRKHSPPSHAGSDELMSRSRETKVPRVSCAEGKRGHVIPAQPSIASNSSSLTQHQATQKITAIASSSTSALKITSKSRVPTNNIMTETVSTNLQSKMSSTSQDSQTTEKATSNVSVQKLALGKSSKEKSVPVKEDLRVVRRDAKYNNISSKSTLRSKSCSEFSGENVSELTSPAKKEADPPVASLSPEAWSKTQLEILELEMRARAIKAMLKAQEDLETTTSSEKQPSLRGPHTLLPSKPTTLQRRRQQSFCDSESSQRKVLHSSPPPSMIISRHRLVRRSVVPARSTRQFVESDRLTTSRSSTRFSCSQQLLPSVAARQQPPSSSSSSNAPRCKLGERSVVVASTKMMTMSQKTTTGGRSVATLAATSSQDVRRRVFTTTKTMRTTMRSPATRRLIRATPHSSCRGRGRPSSLSNNRIVLQQRIPKNDC